MVTPSEQQDPLDALVAAAQEQEPSKSVSTVWRRLTPDEQEAVLFELLGVVPEAGSPSASSEAQAASSIGPMDETAAMAPTEDTELIQKAVEDLRGLTASEGDNAADAAPQDLDVSVSDYWSRWLRRWKVSVLVAGWAVTTTFVFSTDTRSFGPTEWFVAILGSAVLGGVLVGTLANFAVAALPLRSQRSAPAGVPSEDR